MQIQVQTEGGLAYLPGLAAPKTLDSASLSPQDANKMQQLVQAANFFELPAVQDRPARGADYRTYHITVQEDHGKSHSIQVSDPVTNTQLQALLSFVQQHIL
ncbi:protealysin inhibitor emfourin [Dictyobacter kobayashii]|uniref:Uncharacterized protein n=1 Tax=Dictyobacter kobayashii TaxID=2014872 RepID=A0A402AJD7_9CHLR|nr:protealysin inhibitor emfourin [Dictyobacter kobayashii]GCE19237.1 hypothetical protein KDK_30370 [Dictyobacter kobayashii]